MIKFFLSILSLSCFAADYDGILQSMDKIARSYGGVQKISIGKNDQGVPIRGFIIEEANNLAKKVNHLVVGTHHGNEKHAAYVPLEFAKKLINVFKNKVSPYYEKFKSMRFHVVPVLNIGGFNSNNRYEYTRKNKSQDPNRDYPDPCAKKKDFNLKSTYHIAQWVKSQDVVAAITIHGYIGTFTYPWGYYTSNWETSDNYQMRKIALLGAKKTGYRVGTHGGEIYPSAGGFEDWAYYKLGVWSFLSELSYFPSYKENAESYLDFFAAVPRERSKNHGPTGQCTRTFTEHTMPRSRP